jgi:phosphatidylserine/phosphatidylglycerophosphate/cardiolipin synthase-like enzyme
MWIPLALIVMLLTGCASSATGTSRVMLVETTPVETPLDDPDRPDAADVWPALIDGARAHIDWAAFYISDREGSRLTPVLHALTRAVARGVRVRVLGEASFYKTYPDWLDTLDAAGIDVRLIDFEDGGAMHAKYFILDGRSLYVGSQNSDWRSLEHIYEMGVWTDDADATASLATAFAMDWSPARALGEGVSSDTSLPPADSPPAIPADWPVHRVPDAAVSAAMSPEARVVDGAAWDLPSLVDMLNGATDTARLSLLTFYTNVRGRDEPWTDLSDALIAAGARGVDVDVLVADWCKRRSSIDAVKALQRASGVDVKFVTFPEAAEGFIPFARVNHAKYLAVDGTSLWLGTSNWSRDYFFAGRNLGLLVRDEGVAADLLQSFRSVWTSPYAELVDPDQIYDPPRISE